MTWLNLRIGLFKFQRAVVKGGREAEAKFDEGLFARAVAIVHGVELGQGLMRLIDEEEKIFGEIVEKAGRGLAGQRAC